MTTFCSGATWILPKLELLSNGADGNCWKFNDDFLFWIVPNLPHILPYHILILLNYKKNRFPLYIVYQFFYWISWISYSWPPSEIWPRKVLNPRFPLLPYGPVLTILKYTQIFVLFHLFKNLIIALHCDQTSEGCQVWKVTILCSKSTAAISQRVESWWWRDAA